MIRFAHSSTKNMLKSKHCMYFIHFDRSFMQETNVHTQGLTKEWEGKTHTHTHSFASQSKIHFSSGRQSL